MMRRLYLASSFSKIAKALILLDYFYMISELDTYKHVYKSCYANPCALATTQSDFAKCLTFKALGTKLGARGTIGLRIDNFFDYPQDLTQSQVRQRQPSSPSAGTRIT